MRRSLSIRQLRRSATPRAGMPDLIISDVMMPHMTGIEMAITLRQTHPRCKVLLFSGQAQISDLLQTSRAQGFAFEIMPKPIRPADLLAQVNTLICCEEIVCRTRGTDGGGTHPPCDAHTTGGRGRMEDKV